MKADYFQKIIEVEFEKIKSQTIGLLESAKDENQIKFFVTKNIQRVKRLATEAHSLSRELKHSDIVEDSNANIIYVLKVYLIRVILLFQKLFEPFLDSKIVSGKDLRVELFDERTSEEISSRFKEIELNNMYEFLFWEIKEMDKNFDKSLYYLKRNITKSSWQYSALKIFRDKGYIGFRHLAFLLASDEEYSKKEFLKDFFNEFKKEIKYSMSYDRANNLANINDFISRASIWQSFLNSCSIGNYPHFKIAKDEIGNIDSKGFIEIFCFDGKTQCLIPKRTLFEQNERKCNTSSPEGFVKLSKLNQKLLQKPTYIKIGPFKKWFIALGLQVPTFLEMKNAICFDRLNPAERELSKQDSYWNPLKAVTLLSGYSYNSLWAILSTHPVYKFPEEIVKLYKKSVEGFKNNDFVVHTFIINKSDDSKMEIFKEYCPDFLTLNAETNEEYLTEIHAKTYALWIKNNKIVEIPKGYDIKEYSDFQCVWALSGEANETDEMPEIDSNVVYVKNKENNKYAESSVGSVSSNESTAPKIEKTIDYSKKTKSEQKELVRRWMDEKSFTRWQIAQKLYPDDIERCVAKDTLLKRVDRLRGVVS